MSQLADWQIKALCTEHPGAPRPDGWRPMIAPFEPAQIRRHQLHDLDDVRVLSYGISSYGYDVRLSSNNLKAFRRCDPYPGAHRYAPEEIVADPKGLNPDLLWEPPVKWDKTGEWFVLPPLTYCLGETVETFTLPRDILMLCNGKSTNARAGLIANITAGEPGWRGVLTVEIFNALPCPRKVYVNEGVCQMIFWRGQETPLVCYDQRDSMYQDQEGMTLPKL